MTVRTKRCGTQDLEAMLLTVEKTGEQGQQVLAAAYEENKGTSERLRQEMDKCVISTR